MLWSIWNISNNIELIADFFLNLNWNLHLRKPQRQWNNEISSLLALLYRLIWTALGWIYGLGIISLRLLFGFLLLLGPFVSLPLSFPAYFHLVSIVPSEVHSFLWKVAWCRPPTQDRFQILHSHFSSSPHICFICYANYESSDHLFIHCPFTWQLWEKFCLINLNWVVPNTTYTFISQWRSTPFTRKAKQIWSLCLHTLMWAIWKEKNLRLFEDQFGDTYSVWDFFLYLVASWAKTLFCFSCISFDTSIHNLGSLLLLHPALTFFLLLKKFFFDWSQKKEGYGLFGKKKQCNEGVR